MLFLLNWLFQLHTLGSCTCCYPTECGMRKTASLTDEKANTDWQREKHSPSGTSCSGTSVYSHPQPFVAVFLTSAFNLKMTSRCVEHDVNQDGLSVWVTDGTCWSCLNRDDDLQLCFCASWLNLSGREMAWRAQLERSLCLKFQHGTPQTFCWCHMSDKSVMSHWAQLSQLKSEGIWLDLVSCMFLWMPSLFLLVCLLSSRSTCKVLQMYLKNVPSYI